MKRLFLALVFLGSNLVAMTGDGAAANADNQIVARIKAPDANSTEQVVEFTHLQAMRLDYFARFLLMAKNENNAKGELAVEMMSGFKDGVSFSWTTSEILELVRRATVEVVTKPQAHDFVRTLRGDQACLLYPELHHMDFDQTLLAIIENDIAHRLLDDAQFFAQSLAPAHFKDTLCPDLPDCAFSAFLCESQLMREMLLPAHVLCPELITTEQIPGQLESCSIDGTYVCIKNAVTINDSAQSDTGARKYSRRTVYNTQTMQHTDINCCDGQAYLLQEGNRLWIGDDVKGTVTLYDVETGQPVGDPIPGFAHGFYDSSSSDGQLLKVTHDGMTTLYNTQTRNRIGDPVNGWQGGGAFSGDNRFLQLHSRRDGEDVITLYDTKTMLPIGDPAPGSDALFSWDSQLLAVNNNGTTTLYHTKNMQSVGDPVQGHIVDFGIDTGQLLVFTNLQITRYNIQNMKPLGNPVPGSQARFSYNEQCFLAWGNGAVTLYDTQTNQPIGNPAPGALDFVVNDQLVRVFNNDTSFFYDPQTMQPVDSPIPGTGAEHGVICNTMTLHKDAVTTLYAVAGTHLTPLTTFDGSGMVFLQALPSNILAVGQHGNSVRIVKYVCGTNSAQQLAALAAMHRRTATGAVATMLDAKQDLWADTLTHAGGELQKFATARTTKPATSNAIETTPQTAPEIVPVVAAAPQVAPAEPPVVAHVPAAAPEVLPAVADAPQTAPAVVPIVTNIPAAATATSNTTDAQQSDEDGARLVNFTERMLLNLERARSSRLPALFGTVWSFITKHAGFVKDGFLGGNAGPSAQ